MSRELPTRVYRIVKGRVKEVEESWGRQASLDEFDWQKKFRKMLKDIEEEGE